MSFGDKIQSGLQTCALVTALMLVSSLLPACTGSSSPSDRLPVVTTSNIVADWVSNVGADSVSVFPLLPAGTDPHTYQPGASDVARTAQAKVLFSVGLGLEHAWLTRLLSNAAQDPQKMVVLGDYVQPLRGESGGDPDEPFDPHFWWDPLRVKLAVDEIVSRLSEADPGNASAYQANGTAYSRRLDDLDSRIVALTGQIPLERRKIVTSHETMQYFAQRYGYEAVGSIFPGIGTDREPSAAELAQLATKIRELKVDVIFTEPIVTDRLAQSIAAETGARVVRLYTDSLGPPNSEAGTYIGMMDANIKLIYEVLK